MEDEVKCLCAKFPQQPAKELAGVLKRENEAAKKCHICFNGFNNPENRRLRDHCHYMVVIEEQPTKIST